MGEAGVDIQLSAVGFACWPYATECKNLARSVVYNYLDQRKNSEGIPLAIVKANHREPVAIVALDHFMDLVKIASSKIRRDEMEGKLK
jgi:hypothetical protein